MPELPEVETVVRDLRPQLRGRRFEAVEVTSAPTVRKRVLRYPPADAFVAHLRGRRIEAVDRRGKYIVISLDARPPHVAPEGFVIHLGMTGHLRLWEPEDAPVRHTHFRARLDSGLELRFDDPRQFGRLLLGTEPELIRAGVFPRLGPEPLAPELTAAVFGQLVRRRRRPIKAALLDQSFLAGVGNIYADEACFLAGIRPYRMANRLRVCERQALHAAIREVLVKSIAARGSSVIDYVDGFGLRGSNQEQLLVYGRGDQPCRRCGTPLVRRRLAGRGTVYCRKCQR